jgi:hypothetical protein
MSDKPEDSTPTSTSLGEVTRARAASLGEVTVRETLPRFPVQDFRRMVQLTRPEFDEIVAAIKQFDRGLMTVAEAHKLFTTTAPIFKTWQRNVGVTHLFWARLYAGAAQCLGYRFWPYVQKHPDEFPDKDALQRYLRIARRAVFYKPGNADYLPRNAKTLDGLARLDDETPLQPLIDAGEIHARITETAVRALRQRHGWVGRGQRPGGRDPLEPVRLAIRTFVRDHHGQKALLLGFLQAEILRLDPGAEVTLSVEVPDAGEPVAENDDDDDEEAR